MKTISFKVPIETYQEIKNNADSNNTSLSEYIRTAVRRMSNSQYDKVRPEYDLLKQQLSEANEARQRADTIIMQLTRQLEQKTLALEDMRNRSLWRRLKTALGFATS